MKRTASAAILAALTVTLIYETRPPNIVTEYRTQTITHRETIYTDLNELQQQIEQLDHDLNEECIHIIHQQTGDPKPGIRHLIERHYNGNACTAAQEALAGDW